MDEEARNLVGLLQEAVRRVYAEERLLLQFEEEERVGLEQAFVFRTGVHLHELLKETEYEALDLDSEYNKNHGDLKNTPRFTEGIRPDLIIHQRDTHENNKMAVEFKGWWDNNVDRDIKKLEDLTTLDGDYRYLIGAFVQLDRDEANFKFFINGEEIEDNE